MKSIMKMMLVAFTVVAITNESSAKVHRGNNPPLIQVVVTPPVHPVVAPPVLVRPISVVPPRMHRRHPSFVQRRGFGYGRPSMYGGGSCR